MNESIQTLVAWTAFVLLFYAMFFQPRCTSCPLLSPCPLTIILGFRLPKQRQLMLLSIRRTRQALWGARCNSNAASCKAVRKAYAALDAQERPSG